jgi:alkylhydroperoxidase family enzyme
VLDDWRHAPVGAKLHAMLGFLEKLTLHPDAVRPADVAPLRAAGLSDAAIEDAIHASVLFNVYDRLADALDWHLPDGDGYAASGRSLMQRGYVI